MNFTESFEQFSKGLQPKDLMLYAGVGLVLWVLFKDRMTPVQQVLTKLLNKVKGFVQTNTKAPALIPTINTTVENVSTDSSDDIFFRLVVSWKETRDLAEKSGCVEAVKVADQMFPYLSPNVCAKEEL
jgi:hypothetical protein